MANLHRSTNATRVTRQSEYKTFDAPATALEHSTFEAAGLSVLSNASEERAMKITFPLFGVFTLDILGTSLYSAYFKS